MRSPSSLEAVIDFKREVYQQALTELSRFLFARNSPGGPPASRTTQAE